MDIEKEAKIRDEEAQSCEQADEGEEGESDGGLPKGGLGDSVQKR